MLPQCREIRLRRKLDISIGYNDPKHSSKIVKEWLLYRTPKVPEHPPQSSDLNPIEHQWEYVDKMERERNISCKEDLKVALHDEWTKNPP